MDPTVDIRAQLSVLDKEIENLSRDMQESASVTNSRRLRMNRLIAQRNLKKRELENGRPSLIARVRRESDDFIELELDQPEKDKVRIRIVHPTTKALVASIFIDPTESDA